MKLSLSYWGENTGKHLFNLEQDTKNINCKKKKMKLDFFKVKEFSLLKGTIKRGQTRRRGACVCVYEYDKGLVKNIYRTPTT